MLEEFAFDLTPDVTGGGVSWMHSRTAPPEAPEDKKTGVEVEPGPTVKGHDFRIS
jgi:hypothetical protein